MKKIFFYFNKLFFATLIIFFNIFPINSSNLKQITVVSDDNYPPYIFKDENGNLVGILCDQWALWEKKTGIKVIYKAMNWNEALLYFKEGKSDVIDTIFYTPERAKILSFSKPYVKLEVPIFFDKNIDGISNIKSLNGFTVGVKKGDASIDVLKRNGILSLMEFNSYEEIVNAARKKLIHVFVVDKPPALYYLYKFNMIENYKYSMSLYSGEFHRAVKKGNEKLLNIVEEGFLKISHSEYREMNDRWLGYYIYSPSQRIIPY